MREALGRREVSHFLMPFQRGLLEMQLNRPLSEQQQADWERMLEAGLTNAVSAHEAGIRIAVGTDLGPVLGFLAVHWEMELLVGAGLSPLEALRAATRDAAATLGVDNQLGVIAEGAIADLVVLERDPLTDIRSTRDIHSVIKGGRIVDRKALLGGPTRPRHP
jgi:imidazolonepropionase-like amidohydrolase